MLPPAKRDKPLRLGDRSSWPLLLVVIVTTVLGLAWIFST
jgi:hypothetical protein